MRAQLKKSMMIYSEFDEGSVEGVTKVFVKISAPYFAGMVLDQLSS